MALIICGECSKTFSDKASSCPNCGCPNDVFVDVTGGIVPEVKSNKFDLEKTLRGLVDVVFGLFYAFFLYQLIWGSEQVLPSSENSVFEWIGIILGLGFIILIQRIIRAVLGSIGKALQTIFQ
jgi:hypothetical protein